MYESQSIFCFVLFYGLPTSVLLKETNSGGRVGQNRGRCREGETKPSMEEQQSTTGKQVMDSGTLKNVRPWSLEADQTGTEQTLTHWWLWGCLGIQNQSRTSHKEATKRRDALQSRSLRSTFLRACRWELTALGECRTAEWVSCTSPHPSFTSQHHPETTEWTFPHCVQ